MPRIAFISPLGGTGRTATAAHMLSEFAEREHPVLGIDLCPQNQLGRYLGLQEPAAQGWATSVLEDQWWATHALENSVQASFLPFGQPPPSELHPLGRRWMDESGWLEGQLCALDIPDNTQVILDTPVWPAPLARQAAQCADVLMVMVDASLRSCQAFALIQGMLAGVPSTLINVALVLTGFDARRPSHREALQTLRKQWGSLLLPYIIHADESLVQAQARGLCVTQYAPQAQSASDMQGIATWLELQCQMVPLPPVSP
jgi:cellulose synthase operon protein YhjQ